MQVKEKALQVSGTLSLILVTQA